MRFEKVFVMRSILNNSAWIRNRRFFRGLLGVSIVCLFALALLDKYPLKQRASATLLISVKPFSSFLDTPKGSDLEKLKVIQGELTYAFHKQLLQDPSLLKKTYEKLKLQDASMDPAGFLDLKIKRISSDKALFHIALKHRKPNLFLNTLIGFYLEELFESDAKQKQEFLKRIHEKLFSLENLILSQEMALFEMKQAGSSRGKGSPVEELNRHFRSIKEIEKRLRDIISSETIMRQISSGKSLPDSSLSEELQRFKKWHNELRDLSQKYKSTHPQVKKLRQQIVQQENSFEAQKGQLERKRSALMESIGSIRNRVKEVSSDGNEPEAHFSLLASLESNKRIYSQLRETAQKILSEGFFQNTDIQILNLSRVSAPGGFSSLLKGILGFLIVLFMALLGFLHMSGWREKQKNKEEPAVRLDIKTLGDFPLSGIKKNQLHNEMHLLLDQKPDHPLCDEIKRTSNELLIQTQDKNIRSILFTHVGPQSRTIDIVSNLGVSMAQKNKKVLVMDASWHHPLLDAIFSIQNDMGLLNVLLEETSLDAAIQMTEIPNLHVLPTGSPLPQNFDLLSSPFMKTLLERAEKHYDFVFIEAPSCFDHMDIFTLAQYVQGVILVQDSGEKLQPMLAYKSGLNREDIESLHWIGKVNLNR